MSSQNQVHQLALPCEIKNTLENQSIENYSQYGFTGNPLYLNYHKKQKRGVIHDGKNPLKRITISEEQFANIKELCSPLTYNDVVTLNDPLYVVVKDGKSTLLHKILFLKIPQPETIDEAGYNSGTEMKQHYAMGGTVFGMVLGIAVSISMAGILAFVYAIRNRAS